MFGKIDKTYRSTTEGSSKSSPLNIFKPSTRTTSTSESVSIQQRDKLEAQQVMRFGVGEFAGLVVESGRPEFRATFKAEPSKAIKIAPFQEASPAEVAQNFGAIKAQVRAIVGGAPVPAEQPEVIAIAEKEPVESPQDFAIAKPTTDTIAPITSTTDEPDERVNW
jgi:hypothetical protein